MTSKFYWKTLAVALTALFVSTSCSDNDDNSEPTIKPGAIQIATATIAETEASVTVTPTEASAPYYVGIIAQADYDALGTSADQKLFKKDFEDIQAAAEEKALDIKEYLTRSLHKGTATVPFRYLAEGTTYYAYAYGMKTDGTPTSEVTKITLQTKVTPVPDFKIIVSEIGSTQATVTVTPKDNNATYYFGSLSATIYEESIGSIAGFAQYMVDTWAVFSEELEKPIPEVVAESVSKDVDSYKFTDLGPETAHIAFAIGVDANGKATTEAIMVSYTTAK